MCEDTSHKKFLQGIVAMVVVILVTILTAVVTAFAVTGGRDSRKVQDVENQAALKVKKYN